MTPPLLRPSGTQELHEVKGIHLKILTPNMMHMGRMNARALTEPLTLPSGMSDMVDKVVRMYENWYMVWSDAYIPKLLSRPKWFKA